MFDFIAKHFPEAKELGIGLAATLALPIGVLMLDYFIRSKIHGEKSWWELVQDSGPDCCVLSMGATGAIFVDPHVSAVRGMKSPLFALFLVLFLICMRVACIRTPQRAIAQNGVVQLVASSAMGFPSNLKFGLWSLLTISFVIIYGYSV